MKRDDVVCRTVEYLECSFLVLFAAAKLYANKPHTRNDAEKALGRYQKTFRFDSDVENFCLDVLSKRISLDSVMNEKGVRYAQKKGTKREPKRLEP